jgi:hypothetical protein
MNNKTIFGLLAVFIVVASIGSVSAFGGRFFGMDHQSQDNITNAIKTNDYTAWKEAMSAQITEENFNKLVKRAQTMSQRHGNMSEKRGAISQEKLALNQEMNQAITDGNYDAWKTAAQKANSPMISKIDTQDKFNILVQLHQAKQDGNYTKVQELSTQLGLTGGFGKHKMPGFGRGRNN